MTQPTVSSSDKYQKIMEVMSDKTLSQGCVIGSYEVYPEECEEYWTYRIISYVENKIWNGEMNSTPTIFSKRMSSVSLNCEQRLSDFEKHCLNGQNKIIGHPLHIGGVLDWMEKNIWFPSTDSKKQIKELVEIMKLWKDKCLPLSPTDIELIDYIYSLIA